MDTLLVLVAVAAGIWAGVLLGASLLAGVMNGLRRVLVGRIGGAPDRPGSDSGRA